VALLQVEEGGFYVLVSLAHFRSPRMAGVTTAAVLDRTDR
jgi:hypothetical protein